MVLVQFFCSNKQLMTAPSKKMQRKKLLWPKIWVISQCSTFPYLFSSLIWALTYGSHMVSGTRCPAWSDQLKKWDESRAATPKGQCPVGYRGEFPDVLRRPLGFGAIFHVFHYFVYFPCYRIRILHLFHNSINSPCYLVGISHIFNFW